MKTELFCPKIDILKEKSLENVVFSRLFYTVNKDKSKPHHRVMRFRFLLSPPDSWERQLAAGAVNKDKSEPHHRVIRFGFLLSPPDSWLSALPTGAGNRTG